MLGIPAHVAGSRTVLMMVTWATVASADVVGRKPDPNAISIAPVAVTLSKR
jgi:hypothetical protein